MVLNNLTILHCAQYAAPYEGNFVNSLKALEEELTKYGCRVGFVFPNEVEKLEWWQEFSQKHTVFTTDGNVHNSYSQLKHIVTYFRPKIIHCHFEGYDIPVAKAVHYSGSNTLQVWHLHDTFEYQKNYIKRVYQFFCFLRHYSFYTNNVSVIGVHKSILDFVCSYNKFTLHRFLLPKVIPNGVYLGRIRRREFNHRHHPFTFLSFGGRNVQKRIDILVKAAVEVRKQYEIELILTDGVDTKDVVSHIFGGIIPLWCKLIPQQDDVCLLMDDADCFVSPSVHETFSYAICEASIYGLPVIQSDIEGTKWNASNPSTFVFKSGDVEDLSRMMIRVIDFDPKQMEEMCRETQVNNISKYSINNWCNEIIHFYEELLEK